MSTNCKLVKKRNIVTVTRAIVAITVKVSGYIPKTEIIYIEGVIAIIAIVIQIIIFLIFSKYIIFNAISSLISII
jgi:hypothetical protein